MDLPTKARCVIIGGGVVGCSLAYHLTKLGWTDVVLLERKKLTSGTTWHAAGLIAQLRATQNMTRLAKYSQELYGTLEAETGVATGFKRVGSITVALTHERMEELKRAASMARAFGVDITDIGPREVGERYQHLNLQGVVGGVYLPKDGQGDPANIALAMAKGARMRGALIAEHVKVTAINKRPGPGGRPVVTGVEWRAEDGSQGTIAAEHVVNCAGMWGRHVGKLAGASVPLQACEHFYIVTEPIAGLSQMPVLRVPDECAYYKEDAGKYLVGAFEPVAKPWAIDGIPEDFCFDQLPEDMDHFQPILERAINRIPLLETAGIHTFFNGPESFTPDDRYLLGETPEVKGFWVACGFNSIGIQSAGGAGMALAQWMNDGHPPFDLWDVDIRRTQPFQATRHYVVERARESLGLLYADHFPYRQFATARGLRRSPLHHALAARGAVFGEIAGWERANWFANPGQEREYRYSWGRQNWFENARAEHQAVRNDVGVFDMSSFGKIRVEGPEALALLQRLCTADIDMPVGRLTYSCWLNERGGIEADVTISRLSETAFLVVVAAATLRRNLEWLRRHAGDMHLTITDMTAAEAVICVMGPRSRQLLQALTPDDLSSGAFAFGDVRQIEIGMAPVRAHRVSYVGELGWELYVSSEMAEYVLEQVLTGNPKLCGLHVLDSCRIEKGFRHFGHDITDEDHILEAGLGMTIAKGKTGYIGEAAVAAKRASGLKRRLLQFRLRTPEPLLYHNEAIVRDGTIVSQVTSGNYGHHLGGAVALGYAPVMNGESAEAMLASRWEIEVAGVRHAADVSLKPMYDPTHSRMRS